VTTVRGSGVTGIPKSLLRVVFSIALGLVACGVDVASATSITYTGESLNYGDAAHIYTPNNIVGGAGQIKLTGVSGGGFPSTVLAWCVDIYHNLQNSGTYTPESPQTPPLPVLTGAQILQIGGLMSEGDTLLAGSGSFVWLNLGTGLHPYSKNDIAAATQIAIWSTEYSNLTYSVTTGLSSSDFNALVAYLEAHSGNGTNWTLLASVGNNQSLGTVSVPSVPGPIVGGGIPGLLLAIWGLLWARRRPRLAS